MPLHQNSGRWRLGMTLAIVTALFWATLPITLKIALGQLDAWTITWLRFVTAAFAMLLWLVATGKLHSFRGHSPRIWLMMAVAALMLTGNFTGYLFGVKYTTPGNAQLLIQAAPLLMALGGIVVFKEKFSKPQWLGLLLVAAGLISFSVDQSQHTKSSASNYGLGAAFVFGAAVVWAIYALLQKQLLLHLPSQVLLFFIYTVAALLLLPFASPTQLLSLDSVHAWALFYCCLNTVGAYGAFAEALAHWETSRVGVILAMTPILCFAASYIAHCFQPNLIAAEHIEILGWVGALLVINGSILVSMRQKHISSK